MAQETFLNRELGILAFNERVLAQAADQQLPLLERMRYLAISSSNLDEFFEIRVAGLREQLRENPEFAFEDGLIAREAYQQVAVRAADLVQRQYALLNQELLPALEAEGIVLQGRAEAGPAAIEWARDHFRRAVLPLLTPIGLDSAHPFPRVLNKSLNFIVELEGRDAFGRQSGVAIVQAPRALPRLIRLPEGLTPHPNAFMLLSTIMQANVDDLFGGMRVLGCHAFRVTRNSDLFIDDEETTNLRVALQGELPQRHFGDAVRLEVDAHCAPSLEALLMREFGLATHEVYRVAGPVNLARLMQLPDLVERPDLKFPTFVPGLPSGIRRARSKGGDLFQAIRRNDILLHHPYQTFNPVLDFITRAANDPAVVAIKQTIYRTGSESALMESLVHAARRGKEVTVVVELLARFDEETNINWAARLEDVGAHVVYGVVGHKTHAKMSLVVRREDDRGEGVPVIPGNADAEARLHLRRYVHLGTGNYHVRTARLYTDFGLFTANEAICADVHEVFQQLTGLGSARQLEVLWQAPFTLHSRLMDAIRNEARIAEAGRPGRIIAKMNALLESEIILELYAASRAGVKIDLIVRGVCALRPGVPGLSDNISVRSIVGRFLEHSRVFYFGNDGAENVYLSSADWMDRNLFRRVELCFPVLDTRLKRRVITEGLQTHLRDNQLAWEMDGDGHYVRRNGRKPGKNGQQRLIERLGQN